jgi:hypothetical protein
MELKTLEFLRCYEQNSNTSDIPALVSQFAEAFIVGGPEGTTVVRASDFAKALPKRKELFHAMGCRGTELIEVKETQISSRYVLASTKWRMVFTNQAGASSDNEILVDSSFVIDIEEKRPKIILYVSHQDVVKEMQPHK